MYVWILVLSLLSYVSSLQILHISDFHLDVDYSIQGDTSNKCHKDGNMSHPLGIYGDYMCDSPESLIAFSLREAKRIVPNPDVVIWTGDNVPHIDGYQWEYVFNAVNVTTSLLSAQFGTVPHILPTFGNHDYSPANAFNNNSILYQKTYYIWEKFIGADNQATFLKGGYYKYRLPSSTVLVLNTNLYYNANDAYYNFTDPIDPTGQFAFMEAELQKAASCPNRVQQDCTAIVNIVAHIGPGVFERSPDFVWFRPEYNEKFLNLIVKYAKSIGWMFYGHHHTDTFHIIKDANGSPVQLSLMTPAVTPWFSDLDGAGSNNPSFRVYDIDDNSNIQDAHTYYIDLDTLNANGSTSFTMEYSFLSAYGMSGPINASSMSNLLEQMKTNNNLFMKYINYNSVMWKPVMPAKKYRGAQLCSMEWADYPRYDQCLKQYNSSPTLFYGLTMFFLFVFIM